jgi:hypothetical protein
MTAPISENGRIELLDILRFCFGAVQVDIFFKNSTPEPRPIVRQQLANMRSDAT